MVGGLHREGALGGAHGESLTGHVVGELVGVCEAFAEEVGDEFDAGADVERWVGDEARRSYVLVPEGCVCRVGGEAGDGFGVALDHGLGGSCLTDVRAFNVALVG